MSSSFLSSTLGSIANYVVIWYLVNNTLIANITSEYLQFLIAFGFAIISIASYDNNFVEKCNNVSLITWYTFTATICSITMLSSSCLILRNYWAYICLLPHVLLCILLKNKNQYSTNTSNTANTTITNVQMGINIILIAIYVYIAKIYNNKFSLESILLVIDPTLSTLVYFFNHNYCGF